MPLVGVDLDGVIALEDRDRYFQAKAEGVSALRHYYKTLKPNVELIQALKQAKYDNPYVRYNLYTARKNDLPEMQSLTIEWLSQHNAYHLFDEIIFTRWAWKWEVLRDACRAHIDNDHVMLSRLPFIERILYNPFVREGKSIWFTCTCL